MDEFILAAIPDELQAMNAAFRRCIVRCVRVKASGRVYDRGPYGGWYDVTVA